MCGSPLKKPLSMMANSKKETVLSFIFICIAFCVLAGLFIYERSINAKLQKEIDQLEVAKPDLEKIKSFEFHG